MPNSPAPSIRPASINSSLIEEIYWRIKNIPKALAAPGTINGQKVLYQPKERISTKEGTIVTAPGIIMLASSRPKSTLRPGNLNLAKPYPPNEQNSRLSSVPLADTKKVFQTMSSRFF